MQTEVKGLYQKPEMASSLENIFAPFSWAKDCYTESLPLEMTTIPIHHYVCWCVHFPDDAIQWHSCSTCDFSGRRILWGVERAHGLVSCFNTMLYSPSMAPRPLNNLGNLDITFCLTQSTILTQETNCYAIIAGCPMRAFRQPFTM